MSDTALDTTDLKEAFALQLLLKHNNPIEAARAICSDLSYSLFIAQNWPTDAYVMLHRQRLLDEHGAAFFLPTKYDIAHKLIAVADNSLVADDKIKALKLYADLMGMIEKPNLVQNNVNLTENRVMIVPMHGNDDDWQAALLANQRKLAKGS